MSRDEIDIDRLADYLAGAVNGAEAARVAELIEHDPNWRDAYRDLALADDRVSTALRLDAAGPYDPIPADVAARIASALAAVSTEPVSDAEPVSAEPVSAGLKGATVVSLDERRVRRTRRWAAAAAAAVVLGIGGGVWASVAGTHSYSGSSTMALPGAARQPETTSGGAGGVAYPPMTESGANYTLATLLSLANVADAASGPKAATTNALTGSGGDLAAGTLRRLADPVALERCLSLIELAHGGSSSRIDFARFNGQPALIVVLRTSANGAGRVGTTVVAVGADCGLQGTDELGSVSN